VGSGRVGRSRQLPTCVGKETLPWPRARTLTTLTSSVGRAGRVFGEFVVRVGLTFLVSAHQVDRFLLVVALETCSEISRSHEEVSLGVDVLERGSCQAALSPSAGTGVSLAHLERPFFSASGSNSGSAWLSTAPPCRWLVGAANCPCDTMSH